MHSVCTAMIAMGISYVFNKKRILLQGVVGLFALAIIYHGIFNAFVIKYNSLTCSGVKNCASSTMIAPNGISVSGRYLIIVFY